MAFGLSCVDPPPIWIPNVEFQINMKIIREMDIFGKLNGIRSGMGIFDFEEMISDC